MRLELRPNLRVRENHNLLPASQDSEEGSHPEPESTGKATPPQPARPRWERESRAQSAPLLRDFSAAAVGGALSGACYLRGSEHQPDFGQDFPRHCGRSGGKSRPLQSGRRRSGKGLGVVFLENNIYF